jgi:hypothetical protein
MAKEVLRTLDFKNATRITNLPDAVAAQEPATLAQLNAKANGVSWKTSVRAASTANVNTASPGATMDAITLATNDRVLLKDQTTQSQNGIYIWNGAATPLTRATDADTFTELESAVVTVEEGTAGAGTTWRQTQVNGTINTNNVVWTSFGTGAPTATETTAGIAEIATQAETDTGTDDARMVSPLKLATSVYASKKYNTTIGDGTATSYAVTHNLGTKNVVVKVYRNSGNFDEIDCEIQRTSTTVVTLLFDTAPTTNQFAVHVST